MARASQDVGCGDRNTAGLPATLPDFVAVVQAGGATGSLDDDLDAGIAAMLARPGPVLMDVHVARFDSCYPMVPAGAAHNEMLFGPEDIAIAVSEAAGALVQTMTLDARPPAIPHSQKGHLR